MEIARVNRKFWKNKIVFITGHNGFVGSWLCCALENLNVKRIYGYSLKNKAKRSLYESLKFNKKKVRNIYGDINDLKKLKSAIYRSKPDILIHLAAQPIVNVSYLNPIQTFQTNIIGTANLLNISKNLNSIKSILIVTSDKVYKNIEKKSGYRETEELGGHDPYSASKAAAELITNCMKLSFFNNKKKIGIATARAGNIIGGGDWSEYRIIPDIVNSLNSNLNIKLRYPNAVRPWQHVIDAINGYLILIEKLTLYPNKYSDAWNFGPIEKNISVESLVEKCIKFWSSDVSWKSNSNKLHETTTLNLNTSKAKKYLKWKSKLRINKSIELTIDWYKSFFNNQDINLLTKNQVKNFFR